MAKKRPVATWIMRHNPRSEPKFHQIDKLFGAGRSTRAWFKILIAGFLFRIGLNIGVFEWAKRPFCYICYFYYSD